MKDAKAYSVDLESAKVTFLEEMARKYTLPDIGKAIRCLINYARDNPDQHDEIFNEIRCDDCG
jgi:hypothetical protein